MFKIFSTIETIESLKIFSTRGNAFEHCCCIITILRTHLLFGALYLCMILYKTFNFYQMNWCVALQMQSVIVYARVLRTHSKRTKLYTH